MSGTGVVVVAAIIVILLVALYMSTKPGSVRRRSSQDAGVYPGGVYPVAADTGTRDGRGDGGGYVNPTPDAGSSDHGGSEGSAGGDSGGGGGDGGGGDG